MFSADHELYSLYLGIVALLIVASIIGFLMEWKVTSPKGRQTVANINARIRAWWFMCGIFAVANLAGNVTTILLFALLSFLALREFVTLTPTRRSDHRALLFTFFCLMPLQYFLVGVKWYGMFSVLVPVYAFLFIPTVNALNGDAKNFLERTSKLQWSAMICIYCLSHAPALLMLQIPGYEGENAKLLLFMVLVVQLSDVLQYVWGKSTGKRPVAPNISPNKTVEGLIGGVASATLIGTMLWWATPFNPFMAWLMALLISLAGFAGGLTMSAIKRDRGVKDYGTLIEGHGGILDRIDSICFAAPLFFHVVRYFYSTF
ncbi:phosphatidate cytidylyltransferase [bacterium]|nr:phosphatidate cytidylyltransferase [bacterium]